MAVLPIILALAGIAQAGANIAKSIKGERFREDVEGFQEEQEQRAEEIRQQQLKDARRAALARAIGADDLRLPRDFGPAPKAPEMPSTQTEDIVGGLGGLVGAFGPAFSPSPVLGQRQKLFKPFLGGGRSALPGGGA